jgi:hypothetical protein
VYTACTGEGGFVDENKLLTAIGEMMDEKLSAMDAKLDVKLGDVEARLDAKLDKKLGDVEARLDVKLDEKLSDVEARLDVKLDEKLSAMDAKIDSVHKELSDAILKVNLIVELDIEKRFNAVVEGQNLLRDKVERIDRTVGRMEQHVSDIDERVSRIDRNVEILTDAVGSNTVDITRLKRAQ